MSSSVVRRFHVSLGDGEHALFDRVARATGDSRSELIRRAVRQTYGTMSTEEKLEALQETAGAWSDCQVAGAQYVDATRGDLNERLRKLGME